MRISTLLSLTVALTLPLVGQGTVTLVPVQDATIYQPGNVTSNGGGNLVLGINANCSERRALLKFDVAGSLPPGAIVQDVTLSILALSGNTGGLVPAVMDMTVAPILAPWGEGNTIPANLGQGGAPQTGDATWLHSSYPSVLWATPGGHFGTTSGAFLTTVSNRAALSSHIAPSIRTDVQSWLDNPSSNHGYVIFTLGSPCQNTRVVGSRESTTPPELTITYTLGGAPQASAAADGFSFPNSDPDLFLSSNGVPSLGNSGFGLVVPVASLTATLFASNVEFPTFYPGLGLFTFIDTAVAANYLANGIGPFDSTPNPVTGFPEWNFPIPNDPALSDLVVTFQGYYAGSGATNAVTLRLGL